MHSPTPHIADSNLYSQHNARYKLADGAGSRHRQLAGVENLSRSYLLTVNVATS